ncbi:hypothetical protein [Lactobacillus acetotolerans]|uniref:hypothetical protein n=1 Tax=Lactobacillus acetotolerans TaxID=1600 RepID=UPI002FDA568D
MANEDSYYRQLENRYYGKQDSCKPSETPRECNYGEPLEDGQCYWQVQHGWCKPTYIGDTLDDINEYMEATYEAGGGYDTYIDAVTALTDEEGTSIMYVIYTDGEVKRYASIPNRK